ncbi:MAG: response regulator transcription factor [Acidobacteriota bacterium]
MNRPGTLQQAGGAQRILAVDDDRDILQVVRYSLEIEGFEVITAESAKQALDWIQVNGLPHLAVVDIMMPEVSGLDLCREIQRYSDLPVIMLTAIDEEETVVQTIEEIAEDYMTKPFKPKELVARVKRVMRRIGDFAYAMGPVTEIDKHLSVDFAKQKAVIDGKTVSLTPTETKLLHILIRSSRRTVTTDYLLRRVWPLDEVFEDTLRVHIHRLRQKIEPKPSTPRYLITQRGTGYSFLPTG